MKHIIHREFPGDLTKGDVYNNLSDYLMDQKPRVRNIVDGNNIRGQCGDLELEIYFKPKRGYTYMHAVITHDKPFPTVDPNTVLALLALYLPPKIETPKVEDSPEKKQV